MKSNWVNQIIVSIIVLQESVGTVVKNLNLSIWAARSNASSIWVEFHIWNHSSVICKRMDLLVWVNIPQSHSLVITCRCNHSCIIWELSLSYPVSVSFESLNEFTLNDWPHLDSFIVWSREQELAICIVLNTLNWSWVALKNIWECFSIIVPQSNCVILWGRSDLRSIWIDSNIIYTSFVTQELLRAGIWLQAPCHDLSICRTRD